MIVRRFTGLAAAIGPTGNITFPWWCNYVGDLATWAGATDQCRPPTEAELRLAQAAEMGPALTPGSRAAALEAGDEATAAYCDRHPFECAQYRASAEPGTPWFYLALGALGIGLLAWGTR